MNVSIDWIFVFEVIWGWFIGSFTLTPLFVSMIRHVNEEVR